ncbi:unnamed protein product, partial [Heterotrigona itama]
RSSRPARPMGSVPIPFNKASGMNSASSTTLSQRAVVFNAFLLTFLSSLVQNIVYDSTLTI